MSHYLCKRRVNARLMPGVALAAGLIMSVSGGCSSNTPATGGENPKSAQPVQGDPEPQGHPLKDARVGEWVVLRVTSGPGTDVTGKKGAVVSVKTVEGLTLIVDFKKTVTAKSDTEVSFSMSGSTPPEAKLQATFTNGSEKVNLADPFKPIMASFPLDPAKLKLDYKKLDTGNETLTIAGKTYETRWTTYELTGTYDGGEINPAQGKVWRAANIPFGGVVKTEFDGIGVKTVAELHSFGNP